MAKVSRSTIDRITRNRVPSSVTNSRHVLSDEVRSKLSSKSPRTGKPGIFRANLNIPNGVLVIHLDEWLRLDDSGKENLGFFDLGIRIWPRVLNSDEQTNSENMNNSRVNYSKLDTISQITSDEILQSEILNTVFGFNVDFHRRRNSASGVISEFVLLWKWLRHQYDELSCLTDWFLINFAYTCCFPEKNAHDNLILSIEHSYRRSLSLICSGALLEEATTLPLDMIQYSDKDNCTRGTVPIQFELYKSHSETSSTQSVQQFARFCLELLNLGKTDANSEEAVDQPEYLIFGRICKKRDDFEVVYGDIEQTELSKSLIFKDRHIRVNWSLPTRG